MTGVGPPTTRRHVCRLSFQVHDVRWLRIRRDLSPFSGLNHRLTFPGISLFKYISEGWRRRSLCCSSLQRLPEAGQFGYESSVLHVLVASSTCAEKINGHIVKVFKVNLGWEMIIYNLMRRADKMQMRGVIRGYQRCFPSPAALVWYSDRRPSITSLQLVAAHL